MFAVCKKVPVEWYVVVLPFLGLFGFFQLIEPVAFSQVTNTFYIFVSLAFSFLGLLTVTLLLYILFKTASINYVLVKRTIQNMFITRVEPKKKWLDKSWVLSLGLVVMLFAVTFYLQASLMRMLGFSHTADEIVLFSAFFTQLDVVLLGEGGIAKILIFSNNYPLLQTISVMVYDSLALVSGAVLLLVFLKSVQLFRTFMIGFFMIFYLSIPLWYIMPAVSPSQFLLEGVVGEVTADSYQVVSNELALALEDTSPAYVSIYSQLVSFWQGKPLILNSLNEFAITTNPSLHIALGVLCVYCAWRVSLFLGIILAFYQGFNMFATVLLLQHYIIDVPFGLLVGLVGVMFARQSLWYEKEHMMVDREKYFLVIEKTRRDIVTFCCLFVPSIFFKKEVSASDDIR